MQIEGGAFVPSARYDPMSAFGLFFQLGHVEAAAQERSVRNAPRARPRFWADRAPGRASLGAGDRRGIEGGGVSAGRQWFASRRCMVTVVPCSNGSTMIESIKCSMIARPSPPSCLADESFCHRP
jgi:hypothetical protein